MTESDFLGGIFVGLGLFLGILSAINHYTMSTRQRIWGGLSRGWRTKEQAPIEYALARIVVVVGYVICVGLCVFGFSVM
jgi:hypothetical protein